MKLIQMNTITKEGLSSVSASRGLVEMELLFKPALMLQMALGDNASNINWRCMQAFKEVSPNPGAYLDVTASLTHMHSAPGRIQARHIAHRNRQLANQSVVACWEKLE